MSLSINRLSLKNLSLCVYIGNTTSFDDQILINYCSQFGKILSCTILNCPDDKRLFCDFRIIEFAVKQQLDYFLDKSLHKLGSIILDVKLYENLLNNIEILNFDRKIFIGPILNSNHIDLVVQFYKLIDPNLKFCLSKQDYILIEFSSRQYIRTIIQQKTIPQTLDNQIFTIHLPVHPKELIRNQIYIQGLNDQITEKILIDYFEQHGSVIGWCILNPTCGIIEFINENIAEKLLDQPFICLNGANLSLTKLPKTILSSIENKDNSKTDRFLQPTIFASSPEIKQCGWTSPPRAIVVDYIPPPTRLSSTPSTNIDVNIQPRVIETDVKPMKNVLQFIEQFQNEVDQIKDEYQTKFHRDRTSIEYEINRLINDERNKFDKLGRYLNEHRRSSRKHY